MTEHEQLMMGWQALRSFENTSVASSHSSSYSWWPGQESNVYHTQTRRPGDREGLLVDMGAFSNLMADQWLKRVTEHA
eukprot:11797134-Prorocentrum_lima.AAC.1